MSELESFFTAKTQRTPSFSIDSSRSLRLCGEIVDGSYINTQAGDCLGVDMGVKETVSLNTQHLLRC